MVNQYCSADDRVIVLQREDAPQGKGFRRNQGLDLARGKWVVFLDSDDLLLAHCLQSRISFVEHHRDLDFSVSPMIMFEKTPGDCESYFCHPEETQTSDLERFVTMKQPWITTHPMWRRSFLEGNSIRWRSNKWDDWLFNLEVMVTDPTYLRNPMTDCAWRMPCDTVASTRNTAWEDEDFAAFMPFLIERMQILLKSELCNNAWLEKCRDIMAYWIYQNSSKWFCEYYEQMNKIPELCFGSSLTRYKMSLCKRNCSESLKSALKQLTRRVNTIT